MKLIAENSPKSQSRLGLAILEKRSRYRKLLIGIQRFQNKLRIPQIAGFLFSLVVVATLLVPLNLYSTLPVQAAPGIMRWDIVSTPGSFPGRNDIFNPGDIIDMAVGQLGRVVVIVRGLPTAGGSQNRLMISNDYGITWSDAVFNRMVADGWTDEMFNVVVAPDNPNAWAISVGIAADAFRPRNVWYTDDAGNSWGDIGLVLADPNESIRDLDISVAYSTDVRDVGVATVTGNMIAGGGNGGYYIISSRQGGMWANQCVAPSVPPVPYGTADYFNIRFSPNYPTDHSIALVFATNTDNSTYFNIGYHDWLDNDTKTYAFSSPGVEVRNSSSAPRSSPGLNTLCISDLALVSDFQGQSANLRRAYVSLDCDTQKGTNSQDGIFRVDDTHVYQLMDTTRTPDKSIYSIAYYGTFASGKLLVGEHYGYPCTATVPTWFTDSPTVCPIPCWYPALKPPTGATNQGTCATGIKDGVGAARVAWDDEGTLAFAGTGSLANLSGRNWYTDLLNDPLSNDESAFSVSRTNGETWNQTGLINTTIDWLNDVAPSLDCTTVYLASVNRNIATAGPCNEFDSVWRSTMNIDVAKPLPISQVQGQYWERVLTHTTSLSCRDAQSDLPILRVPEICDDEPDGRIVAWAARFTRAQMWSGDYGNFWAEVPARDPIQDFTFGSSTVLYDLSPPGMVQKLTYTGKEWSNKATSSDSRVNLAHTIAVFGKDKILVGAASENDPVASFSPDDGKKWITVSGTCPPHGNIHVAFDVEFGNNKYAYIADDQLNRSGVRDTGLTGSIYRQELPSYSDWPDVDMMTPLNNNHPAVDWPPFLNSPPHIVGQFGIVTAKTGDPQPAVYTVHDNLTTTQTINNTFVTDNSTPRRNNSGACRTIKPWEIMPDFGIPWDCLETYAPNTANHVRFTLEPTALKYCGCCTLDTYTTLWAIDNVSGGVFGSTGYDPTHLHGMLWAYTDCLAKRGPALKAPEDNALVGCDPVSGRNQQVDLSWEQLCVAVDYEYSIGKDRSFYNVIFQHYNPVSPADVLKPAVYLSPGSLPEAGATYFWRVRVTRSSTGQLAVSPWSVTRSFAVKPGFVTTTPVYGLELLSPKNGCTGCAIKPTSLSWAPYKEATKYEVVLAKDAEMKQLIKKAITTTTGYEYKDALEYDKSYFWRVRAIEIKGQSNPSDWSSTFTFTTESAPPPPPDKEAVKAAKEKQQSPSYVWLVIAVFVVVPVAMLVLIMKTRRQY